MYLIMRKLLYTLFVLLLLAPVTGELWHIPIGPFDFLPSDVLILLIFPLWTLDKLVTDRKVRIGKIGLMIAVFLLVMVTTYFLNMLRFDFGQMFSGFILMGRFGMYVIVSGMAFDLLDRDVTGAKGKVGQFRKLLIGAMILSLILISLLGFFQLKFFPSFLELGLYLEGWDPHIGRLLSTWFDPNFIGGYLAFILPVILALSLYFKRNKQYRWAVLLFAACVDRFGYSDGTRLCRFSAGAGADDRSDGQRERADRSGFPEAVGSDCPAKGLFLAVRP